MKLQIGDKAPDFTTTASFGGGKSQAWTLSEEVKKGPILLIFYPGDFTSVCTKQLCDYRDNWDSLKRFNVQIVGVSTNGKESHDEFAKSLNIPFPLLDDSSKEICRKLDMLMLGLMASRGFVLIDNAQNVRYQFKELLPFFKRSAQEVAEILKTHATV